MQYRGPASRRSGDSSKQVWWACGMRRGALVVVAIWLIFTPHDKAFAACVPQAGNDVTATCTGATVDQGAVLRGPAPEPTAMAPALKPI